MQKNNKPHTFIIAAFIFVCGFITGVGVTVYKTQPIQEQVTQQKTPAPGFDHKALHDLEEKVKENPNDGQMWKVLSEMYFDSNQISKAIPAYQKTIELIPNDPGIITDLGVMYRRNKEPHKAIESFKMAIAVDPKHEQSRFNVGIVTLYDLEDKKAAIAAFEELLAINPDAKSGNGGKVSEFVEYLKTGEQKK
ncbi:MAG: hypothetical protein OCC45_07940 [Desulfotalea sp.]